MSARPLRLYDFPFSGNGYKVRLLLAQLGQKYDWTDVDIDKGLTRTPEFLKRNPNGRIPTLELDDGTVLAEITAICEYVDEVKKDTPSLIGGARITVGDSVIDASVEAQLHAMATQLRI